MTSVKPPAAKEYVTLGPPWDPTYLVKEPNGNIVVVGSGKKKKKKKKKKSIVAGKRKFNFDINDVVDDKGRHIRSGAVVVSIKKKGKK